MYQSQISELKNEIAKLKEENNIVRKKLAAAVAQCTNVQKVMSNDLQSLKSLALEKETMLSKFLNQDQLEALTSAGKKRKWSQDSIIKGLKFRFCLGVKGYQFLLESKYPLPSYSTLNRKLTNFKIQTGLFSCFWEPLKVKAAEMSELDRYCSLMIDEMEISCQRDYDKYLKKYFGNITLGDVSYLGTHILVGAVRGVKSPWKQIIACEVTGSSIPRTHMRKFVNDCINFAESAGLYVISVSSDMGNNNRGFWKHVEVLAGKSGQRNNKFSCNDHDVYIIPDSCHLLKNLKNHLLTQSLILPDYMVQAEGLPTEIVSGNYITALWKAEIGANKEVHSLYHLTSQDIDPPDNFYKMNVASAVRYFSLQTANGIRLAVKTKLLPETALSTAWFIELIYKWFNIVTSRVRIKSVTKKNSEDKWNFLL